MSPRSLGSNFFIAYSALPRALVPGHFRSGYKEQQYLVVVNGAHQSSHRDE